MKAKTSIDAYMPFYGKEFMDSMDGHDDLILASYIRALWHYWGHFHCTGIPDDDSYMRRVCRQDEQHWVRVRAVIFGGYPFFELIDGRWHQKKASEIHTKSSELYQKRVDQAKVARFNNPKNQKQDQPKNLALDLKQDLSLDQEQGLVQYLQPKPKPESDLSSKEESLFGRANTPKHRSKKNDDGAYEIPTLQQVIEYGESIQLSNDECIACYEHYEKVGWVTSGRVRIKRWKFAVNGWKRNEHKFNHSVNGTNGSSRNGSGTVQAIQDQKEYERIIERMKVIRGQYADHQSWDKKDVEEWAKLRDRKTQLKTKLGMLV